MEGHGDEEEVDNLSEEPAMSVAGPNPVVNEEAVDIDGEEAAD